MKVNYTVLGCPVHPLLCLNMVSRMYCGDSGHAWGTYWSAIVGENTNQGPWEGYPYSGKVRNWPTLRANFSLIESYLFTILVYMVAIHVLYLHAKGQGRADWDKNKIGRGAEGVKTGKMAIKWSFFHQ